MDRTTVERDKLIDVVNTLPDEALLELANFLDYLRYKSVQRKEPNNNADSNNESNDLVNQVLRQIGLNILLYQQIEKGLKLLIPFMSNPNSDAKEINLIRFRLKPESLKLQTLGNLLNNFINLSEFESDYFPNYLKKIVEERNQLIHHFGNLHGLNILNTEEGCQDCLAHLQAQQKEAASFYKDLRLFTLVLVYLLQENCGESNPKINQLYKNLKTTVIGQVEYINLLDPSDTVWENTKIVALLRLAEVCTEKIEDLTLLSQAGKFIKNQDPECNPKNYGIKTLKDILKVSGLFEIIENQDGAILYKSKGL